MPYIRPRTKLLYHLDRLQAIRHGGQPPPISVEIDLSNRCSLGCEWCHFAYTHTRGPLAGSEKPAGRVPGGDLMDTNLALAILSELLAFGVRSVIWTGGGEPTLHPDFERIISDCGIEQGIYTHGGHIGRERAELMKRRLTWAYISLDAADRESYRRLKGADRFEAACRGIRNLVEAEGEAVIGVGFLLNRQNWTAGEAMIDLAFELGADYVQFRPAVLYDQEAIGTLKEYPYWVTPCARWLREVASDVVFADADRFLMYRNWSGRSYGRCYWTQLATVITPNGKVWRCLNKREHAEALMGDLTRESFKDIWSRSGPWSDFGRCRVMCRGHLPNLTLEGIMSEPAHANFI